ncbi:MAG: hypothetical protein QME12_05345 [Nanoarchaeota archaeon]|nr:hypothetical protein [Nanoarchaeota archaeon]
MGLKFYAGLLFALAAAERGYNYAMEEIGYSPKEYIQVREPLQTECLVGSEHGCLRHKGEKLEMRIPE